MLYQALVSGWSFFLPDSLRLFESLKQRSWRGSHIDEWKKEGTFGKLGPPLARPWVVDVRLFRLKCKLVFQTQLRIHVTVVRVEACFQLILHISSTHWTSQCPWAIAVSIQSTSVSIQRQLNPEVDSLSWTVQCRILWSRVGREVDCKWPDSWFNKKGRERERKREREAKYPCWAIEYTSQ